MLRKFRGVLLGCAIGDALGAPVEGMKFEIIKKKFGKICKYLPFRCFEAGTFTDDTQLALAVAKVLCEANTYEEAAERFSKELVNWYKSDDWNVGPGRTCTAAAENIISGKSWWESGIYSSLGTGACMRAASIGVFYHHDVNNVLTFTEMISKVTHPGEIPLKAAQFTALMALYLSNDMDVIDAVKASTESIGTLPDELKKYIEKGLKCDCTHQQGFLAHECIGRALHAMIEGDSMFDSVIIAVNMGGDADTVGAIVGSWVGARWGDEKFPDYYKRNLLKVDEIIERAVKMHIHHLRNCRRCSAGSGI